MKFNKISYLKKIFIVIGLLIVGAVASILFNYENTRVFLNINKKLPIYSVDTKAKKIAISFDSSWGDDNTEEILNILDKYNVKATFFVLGGWVERYPEKVKAMKDRGHEIGNHTYSHPDMTKISRDKIIMEIAATDSKIKQVTGEGTILFRCPSGAYNNLVIETVESTKHYCLQWDVDSIDWKAEGVEKEYNRVISKTKPGSILLFHNDAKYTPKTLPRIIEKLQKDGYEFMKISQLIYKDNYRLDLSGKQISN